MILFNDNDAFQWQLPDGVSVSRDAKSALGKAASIFVLYTTSCAHKFADNDGRSVLSAQDIVSAASHMGFQEFTQQLKVLYQENKREREKLNQKRRERRKQQKQNQQSSSNNNEDQEEENEESGEEEEEEDDD